ncbi:MAG TPA: hypothetical protein VMQ73_25160 [Methylomirabilota bacterium]|nr:hypothetical protein [Methylomirabilota bacterium]
MLRNILLAALVLVAGGASSLGADLAPDQQSAICGKRSTCSIAAVKDAGRGVGGVRLAIVEARLGLADKVDDAPDDGCRNDSGDGDGGGGHEFWLVQNGAAPRLLLSLCNDGYGAAGVGEDDIKVVPNGLVHRQAGGSAWRWDVTEKIRLSPLAITHALTCSFNTLDPLSGVVVDVDRLTLHARSVGYAASAHAAGEDGSCPNWPTGPDSVMPTGPELAGAYAIPRPMDGLNQFPEGTSLADCALELTTDGLHGFLVYGKAASASDAASLRMIAETAQSFLVQVRDPTAAAELAAGKAKSWVQQPHVEVWTRTEDDSDANGPPKIIYRQFAVGLDGGTFAGAGEPTDLPTVQRWTAKDEAGSDVTVLRLAWASEEKVPEGIGIAYSQAADGQQARLVSSALIRKNRPLYLPAVWNNAREENGTASGIPSGTCAVDAAGLLRLAAAP